MSQVFKALSDPSRRRVLQLLRERPMSAGELADHFDVSKPTMSAHFAVLREANLIEPTKKGTMITYHLKMSVLEEALLDFAETFGLEVKRGRRPATAAKDLGTDLTRAALRRSAQPRSIMQSGRRASARSSSLDGNELTRKRAGYRSVASMQRPTSSSASSGWRVW